MTKPKQRSSPAKPKSALRFRGKTTRVLGTTPKSPHPWKSSKNYLSWLKSSARRRSSKAAVARSSSRRTASKPGAEHPEQADQGEAAVPRVPKVEVAVPGVARPTRQGVGVWAKDTPASQVDAGLLLLKRRRRGTEVSA